MHNLFLGTAKYMMHKVWIDEGYLDARKLHIIEERLAYHKMLSTLPRVSYLSMLVMSSFHLQELLMVICKANSRSIFSTVLYIKYYLVQLLLRQL